MYTKNHTNEIAQQKQHKCIAHSIFSAKLKFSRITWILYARAFLFSRAETSQLAHTWSLYARDGLAPACGWVCRARHNQSQASWHKSECVVADRSSLSSLLLSSAASACGGGAALASSCFSSPASSSDSPHALTRALASIDPHTHTHAPLVGLTPPLSTRELGPSASAVQSDPLTLTHKDEEERARECESGTSPAQSGCCCV